MEAIGRTDRRAGRSLPRQPATSCGPRVRTSACELPWPGALTRWGWHEEWTRWRRDRKGGAQWTAQPEMRRGAAAGEEGVVGVIRSLGRGPARPRRSSGLLHVCTRGDQHKAQKENWLVSGLSDQRYRSVKREAKMPSDTPLSLVRPPPVPWATH